jgi:hypothetical protein
MNINPPPRHPTGAVLFLGRWPDAPATSNVFVPVHTHHTLRRTRPIFHHALHCDLLPFRNDDDWRWSAWSTAIRI